MNIDPEEAKELYKQIQIACADAGVRITKTANLQTNIGFRPEMALAMQLIKIQKREVPK